MKVRIVLFLILRILLNTISATAQEPDRDISGPLPGYVKAVPNYPIHYQCPDGRTACVHNGGREWFNVEGNQGRIYVEVFGGAQITGVYDANQKKLDVKIQNHIGFFYEGTRYAYITGIPPGTKLLLIGISIPGYGPADFGAK